jgi:hypothetical protein
LFRAVSDRLTIAPDTAYSMEIPSPLYLIVSYYLNGDGGMK